MDVAQSLLQSSHLLHTSYTNILVAPTPPPPFENPPSRFAYLQLVAKDMVLTAAHCAGYASAIELGRPDQSAPFDVAINERIEVSYEIKHPLWDASTVDADYMLVKLVRPSTYFPMVRLNADPAVPTLEGEGVTIMGFGDTNPDDEANEPSDTLLEVSLEYVPDDMCRAKKGQSGEDVVDYSSKITENMM